MYRILAVMWVQPPSDSARAIAHRAPLLVLGPLWLLAFANIYFGVDASFLVGLAEGAAQAAIDGSAGL